MNRRQRQGGFAYIAAIILLVVLAAMAAAVVRLNTVQQVNTNLELQGLQATQAARAGIEWGLFQVRANPCNVTPLVAQTIGPTTLTDFAALTGFRVTVTIRCRPFREGEFLRAGVPVAFTKIAYDIDAVACNGAGACPDNGAAVAREEYVERRRTASACTTTEATQPDCYVAE